MQLVNTTHPNSPTNTSVLAVYKAGDSKGNLHTALDHFDGHIQAIEGMKWRYIKSIITQKHDFSGSALHFLYNEPEMLLDFCFISVYRAAAAMATVKQTQSEALVAVAMATLAQGDQSQCKSLLFEA